MCGDSREEDLFRKAMREVQPLEKRRRRRTVRPRCRAGEAPRCRDRAELRLLRTGERQEGLAPGVDRRLLRRLRRGEPPPQLRLDLHGLEAGPARRAVRELLDRAWTEGKRCLLVIHGRGLGSPGEPVLKTGLPAWLAEEPGGSRVLAFATAPPGLGGAGATLVLLRRDKRRRR